MTEIAQSQNRSVMFDLPSDSILEGQTSKRQRRSFGALSRFSFFRGE